MGQMVNPGNEEFTQEVNSWVYVDKTGLIDFTNSVCDTADKFVCNSRPRRFGKSYAADMLTAYYSCGCNSEDLFRHFKISRTHDYEKYRNKCDVIHFDVQWCMFMASSDGTDLITWLNRNIVQELSEEYPDADLSGSFSVFSALYQLNKQLKKTFVVIIDEWDAPIRDDANDKNAQDAYIKFLRALFKGAGPMKYIRLAYMTGILPIRRQRTESALNNFTSEFTMIDPGPLAEYMGFTEEEVQALCRKHGADYEDARKWYDGYLLDGLQIYNPNSVCRYLRSRNPAIYWTATASFESVHECVNIDFDGLKKDLIDMIAGLHVRVNTATFENHTDRSAFNSKDNVFTYLIHLGYLAWDASKSEAFIPNEEIRQVIGQEVSESRWTEFDTFEQESLTLLDRTIAKDGKRIASAIEQIHDRFASSIWYNNENSLAAVITIGYLATLRYYFKPVREMPAGKGFADIVYVPRPDYRQDYPALVIELKWDKNVHTALDQIRMQHYPESLAEYTGNILLIGISYDRKTKKHTCITEETAL